MEVMGTYMELDMVTDMKMDTVDDTEIDKVADNEDKFKCSGGLKTNGGDGDVHGSGNVFIYGGGQFGLNRDRQGGRQ